VASAGESRGRIQAVKIADLTLFDPLIDTDHATCKAGENGPPSSGIPCVIVHGTTVVRDSKVLAVKPGRTGVHSKLRSCLMVYAVLQQQR
jgi:N-acyl-D-glutamate deacylase